LPIDFIEQLAFSSSMPLISAFFIGLATAISPCAFAANVAAIGYISRNIDNPLKSLRSGIMFTLGRTVTYMAIGMVMIIAGRVIGSLARDTQTYSNIIIGPILLLIGLVFMGVISFNMAPDAGIISRAMKWFNNKGEAGAFLMGAVFAFAFCPYSGLMFFGLLIPLALGSSYGMILPGIFGIGVSIPVLIFVGLLYFSASRARNYGRFISSIWPAASILIGTALIIVGTYYISPYIESRVDITYVFELLCAMILSFSGLVLLRRHDKDTDGNTRGQSGGKDHYQDTSDVTDGPYLQEKGIPRSPIN